MNEHGVRTIPRLAKGVAQRYALFLGCSYTFGDGVGDSETLPAPFGARAPAYHVYNFATTGYGPPRANEWLAGASASMMLRTDTH